MAFPFGSRCISQLSYIPDKKAFCFRLFSIPFKTYLGKDFTDKRKLLERLEKGDIKLCTSHIQLKDGKIFWLATFEVEKEKHSLKPEKIAEASLSLEYPIVVKMGKARLTIGTQEEFYTEGWPYRLPERGPRWGLPTVNREKGVNASKLKAVDKFRNTETNYVSQRIHVYSRKLIDFCIKHQAGTLILVNQEDKIGIAKEEEFVLRNWSYYDLMTKIKYKAEKAGIELITD